MSGCNHHYRYLTRALHREYGATPEPPPSIMPHHPKYTRILLACTSAALNKPVAVLNPPLRDGAALTPPHGVCRCALGLVSEIFEDFRAELISIEKQSSADNSDTSPAGTGRHERKWQRSAGHGGVNA